MFNRSNQRETVTDTSNIRTTTNAEPHMTMTVEELAAELSISRPTAYKLVRKKGFPSFTIGQRILIYREGVKEWIQKQCDAQKTV